MEYIYSDTNGVETKKTDIEFIKKIIKKPYENWLEGTGDSSIHINPTERIVFFKLKEGILLLYHPDYISPLIKKGVKPNILIHYVGGEPMEIPDICLCDEDIAFKIITHFIESKGELSKDYEWVDIFASI
jgi:hypothetical protein